MSMPRRALSTALTIVLALAATPSSAARSRAGTTLTVRANVVRHASVQVAAPSTGEPIQALRVETTSNGAALRRFEQVRDSGRPLRTITLFAP